MPTEHARGPWDPRALHGGAPAALMAGGFERMRAGRGAAHRAPALRVPAPGPARAARRSSTRDRARRPARPGAGGRAARRRRAGLPRERAARAAAPAELPEPARRAGAHERAAARARAGHAGALRARRLRRAPSFAATAMEMRWLDDPRAARARRRVWMRLRPRSLAGEPRRRCAPGGHRGLRQRRQRRAAVRALPVHQRRPVRSTCTARRAASGSASTRAPC